MTKQYSAEFATSIRTPVGEVAFMPDRAARLPRPGRGFVARETRRSLSNLQTGQFLLLKNEFPTLDSDSARAHINIHEDLAPARQESRRKVRFGQLIITDQDQRERVELIAQKPLPTPGVAAREFGAIMTINSLAGQGLLAKSLHPLGFYRDPEDDEVSLLTKYEHSILTLDTIFWDPHFTPSEQQLRAGLGHCAISLGELHKMGIAHADAQVKNIAADNFGIRYVDLEDAQEMRTPAGEIAPLLARSSMTKDIDDCLGSLRGHGSELVRKVFVPTYLDIVMQESALVPAEAVPTSSEIARMMR